MAIGEPLEGEENLQTELAQNTEAVLKDIEKFASLDQKERKEMLPTLSDKIWKGVDMDVIRQHIFADDEDTVNALAGHTTKMRLQKSVGSLYGGITRMQPDLEEAVCITGIVLDRSGKVRAVAGKAKSVVPDPVSYGRALLGALYALHNTSSGGISIGKNYASKGEKEAHVLGFAKGEFVVGVGGAPQRILYYASQQLVKIF